MHAELVPLNLYYRALRNIIFKTKVIVLFMTILHIIFHISLFYCMCNLYTINMNNDSFIIHFLFCFIEPRRGLGR